MKFNKPQRISTAGRNFFRRALAAMAVSISCAAAIGQVVEPQALRLQISNVHLGLRVEAEQEDTIYAGSKSAATFERLFMGPIIGLTAAGSVYHPNLLTFSVNGEFSPGYNIETTTYSNSTNRKEIRYLGNYYANLILLQEKPYRSTFYLSQNYTYRDYDFFNRAEANIWRYGANLGYQEGPVPFTIDVWQRKDETFGESIASSLYETGVTFNARNTRESGETTFTYTHTNDDRTDSGSQATSTENSFGIGDTETFGREKQIHLNTSANYSSREYTGTPADDATAALNLSVQHTPSLSSVLDMDYNRSTTNDSVGKTLSDNLHGGVSVQHQLFESLTSTLRIQGQDSSSSGSYLTASGENATSITETKRYGGGVTESYTKRLGSVGRVTLMGSVLYEHTIQTAGGDTIIQTDESHGFTSSNESTGTDSFFLNLPYVDESTILITNTQHALPAYQEGRDYIVSKNGYLTMIRRAAASTIPANSTVLVSYHAKASGSGEYNTFTGLMNLRVDLWNDLLAFYFRMSSIGNSGARDLFLQDMDLYSFGAESTWRWLHAGVEYASNASTYSTSQDVRLFQSLSFKLDEKSTLNLDLLESKTHYVEAARDEMNYSLITRYQRTFNRNLGVQLDAGIAVRRGKDVDQTLATVRPSLEWNIGQLSIKASYSYEYGEYAGSDQRKKHMMTISAQRNF